MQTDLAIKSRNIITPEGSIDGVIQIADGKIVAVGNNTGWEAIKTIDAGNNFVMPGIIDPHVHINEPGRTEWEGFDSATRAAAAGGITTVIDMPLNSSPVTTSIEYLKLKIASAEKSAHINCGFYGGVVPGNLKNLEALLDGGVFGLKAFLTHSGIDDFPATPPEQLRDVLLLLKKYDRPLLVHCELDNDHEGIQKLKQHPESYMAYLASRPKSWEDTAIRTMINLCHETGAHVHIVHLSSASALPDIIKARKEGLPLTVETAPHYLFFDAASIGDKQTQYKCAPPIREKENNDQLWQALKDGIIDFIATDHSPAPPSMKETESGNFEKAWGGIAGLQFSLPVVWTEARKRGFTVVDISRLMCENTAKFLQLDSKKGCIKVNHDADIVIWNPEKEIIAGAEQIYHRHKLTPYSGLKLKGEVHQTIVNGKLVFDRHKFPNLHSGKVL